MIEIIFISFLALLNVAAGYVIVRLSKRLLAFDDLFEMLLHDIEVNIKYFDSVSESPLVSNAQEVIEADRNMRMMRLRLEEYTIRISEQSHKKKRFLKPKRNPNPPVVA